MRELIISRISNYGWLDYAYKRGDYKANTFAKYADWLRELSDEDLLETYGRVTNDADNLD